jgi:beta-1,4-N-acetylglucosaminyltransferase
VEILKICFIASSGGHLEQLLMLTPLMKKYESYLVTEKTNYQSSTDKIRTYKNIQINRREIFFFIKFIWLIVISIIIFLRERPDVIISTGALFTIPMCVISKLFRRKLIYIESFSKINTPTITGKIIYKLNIADLFLVQWEEMKKIYPKAICKGGIY